MSDCTVSKLKADLEDYLLYGYLFIVGSIYLSTNKYNKMWLKKKKVMYHFSP